MSNSVFQSVMLQLKETTDRVFGVIDTEGYVVSSTDVAFLDNGVAGLQGPLSQIRTKYRSEAYLLETEREEDTAALLEAFSDTEKTAGNRLTFYEKQNTLHDVLGFAAQRKLSLVKLERAEPSLESLFMEVTGK